MSSKLNLKGKFVDFSEYNSISLEKYKAQELRSEYRKLRKEAKRRIKELSQSEFSDSKLLENKEYLYEEDPSLMTKRDLRHYLSAVAGFLNSDLSTVEGQRKRAERTIETLNDMGYENIDLESYKNFGRFMDKMRVYVENNIIASDKLIEIYDTAKEKNISIANVQKNIRFYERNLEAIKVIHKNCW